MSKIYFDVYAIELEQQTIDYLVEKAKPLGWNLDHLEDNMNDNAESGFDTMLFLKLYRGTTEIATFTDQPQSDVADCSFRLTDETDPIFGIFHKIENI